MELKSYLVKSDTQDGVIDHDQLLIQIMNSSTVSNFSGVRYQDGYAIVMGDSLLNEDGLDSVFANHEVTIESDAEIARYNAKVVFNSSVLLRAIIKILIDELNVLRSEHSLSDLTYNALDTLIKNKIDSGDAD